MKRKYFGIGSISLLLVIIAFLWSFDILEFCVGDFILTMLNIPTWSNMSTKSGIHFTIYFSFIFLIPALLIGIKFQNDLFAKTGKLCSIIFLTILISSNFFLAI